MATAAGRPAAAPRLYPWRRRERRGGRVDSGTMSPGTTPQPRFSARPPQGTSCQGVLFYCLLTLMALVYVGMDTHMQYSRRLTCSAAAEASEKAAMTNLSRIMASHTAATAEHKRVSKEIEDAVAAARADATAKLEASLKDTASLGVLTGEPTPQPMDEDTLLARMPPCAARPGALDPAHRAKAFFIMYMGHSASTAVISEMGQHSDIYVDPRGPEPVDHHEYEANTTLALEYTRAFFDAGIKLGKIPGFKLRPTHVLREPDAWRALVKEYDVRLIWNFRANAIKQASGEYRHRYLKDNSVIEGLRDGETLETKCADGGCAFNITNMEFFHTVLTDLLNNDNLITRAVATLQADGCVLSLPYEEYLYSRDNSMAQVYRFLGVPFEDHQPNRQKATSDNLCDAVANVDDLCHAFYGCLRYRWMFDDGNSNGCKCVGLAPSSFEANKGYCGMARLKRA